MYHIYKYQYVVVYLSAIFNFFNKNIGNQIFFAVAKTERYIVHLNNNTLFIDTLNIVHRHNVTKQN